MKGWFNTCKSTNVMKIQDKINHMIISIDAKMLLTICQICILIYERTYNKNSEETKNRRWWLDIIKVISENPTVEIILNGEKNWFPLKSWIRRGWPVSPLLFNIVLEILVRAIGNRWDSNKEERCEIICNLQILWSIYKRS
jgi:hypothetical protein